MNEHSENCIICANHTDFHVPAEILEAAKDKNLVIFAGAGISTEGAGIFPNSLYEEIIYELRLATENEPSFPELMTMYCERVDGRRKLLAKIIERLEYWRTFPEVHRTCTRFHKALSTIPHLNEIYTTNWDTFFESECHATPIIFPEDLIALDLEGRKVIKLHGSINNLGSIVLTTEDYNQSYNSLQNGLIGSHLKLTLANKTVLFVGFSFQDFDFLQLMKFVNTEIKDLMRQSFAIVLNEPDASFEEMPNIIPIQADAVEFIEALKEHLIAEDIMLDPGWISDAEMALAAVKDAHHRLYEEFNIVDNPEVIYCAIYQDGLMHSLEHMISKSSSGIYSDEHYFHGRLRAYESLHKSSIKNKDYADAAYLDGYLAGLTLPMTPKPNRFGLPMYFAFKSKKDLLTLQDYQAAIKNAPSVHKSSYQKAVKEIEENGYGKDVVIHHPPFL